MMVKRLIEAGLKEFSDFIEDIRNGSKRNTPFDLLDSEFSSEPINIEIEIERFEPETRYHLGRYINDVLEGHEIQPLLGDCGFWSWLALYWFDDLCPQNANGTRKPSETYSYILSVDWKHRPRHAIYMTWQLVRDYGETSRFMISRELPVRGEIVEQLMGRQKYLSCEGVIHAAAELYYDKATKTFKRGSTSGAGAIRRYATWLRQIEVTYDLFSINKEGLMALLPPEYNRFRVADPKT